MSLLSSNNAGLQDIIKQWWIDIRNNNFSVRDVSSDEITTVKVDDGYVILDFTYVGSSVKIILNNWNKRPRLLRGIYKCYPGSKKLRSIAIDIISTEQDAEIDFIGMTDKLASPTFDSYLTEENDRWAVSVMSHVNSALKIHGLHRDKTDIKIAAAKDQEIYDFEGDINIRIIDSNDSWPHYLKDIRTTGFVRFDMRESYDSWKWIQINRKKNRWGFVLNPKYLDSVYEFYKHNQSRVLFNLEIPPEENISYDWRLPVKATYEVSKCLRYGYRLIDSTFKF